MRFDSVFVPKGNGLGWTLNFHNPLSWIVLIAILLFVFIIRFADIKRMVLAAKNYTLTFFKGK